MWDRGLRVRNVVFMNFPSNETRAIQGPIILDRCTDRCGGMHVQDRYIHHYESCYFST